VQCEGHLGWGTLSAEWDGEVSFETLPPLPVLLPLALAFP
jgi:hypothetical protein